MKVNLDIATIECKSPFNSGMKTIFKRYDEMTHVYYYHNFKTGKYLAKTKRSTFWLGYNVWIHPSVKPVTFSQASPNFLRKNDEYAVLSIGYFYAQYLLGNALDVFLGA